MSNLLRTLLAACVVTGMPIRDVRGESTVARDSFDEVAVFAGGDLLDGRLQSFEIDGDCVWEHPDASAPITIQAAIVRKFTLHHHPFTDGPLNSWKLQLHNGDSIEGTDPVLEGGNLRLQSINLGGIVVPKPYIARMVQVLQRRPPIYRGFDGIDGWTVGKVTTDGLDSGDFVYTNKAVYAFKAASLARDFKLPDIASINMDIAWKGTLGIAIGLYTDTLEPISLLNKEEEDPFGGFYSLAIFNQGAVLRAITHKDPIRTLGQMFVPVLNQKDHARIEIRVSRPMNAIQLALDGEVVHTFIDQKGFIGEGSGVRIVHQGRGSVRISNFEIRHWNGEIEDSVQASPFKNADLVWVDGSPQVTGKVTGISPTDIVVERDGRRSTIASADVRRIEFRLTGYDDADQSPPNARLRFSNGDRITLKVGSISATNAVVEAFGSPGVSIDRTRIEEIDFAAVADSSTEEEDDSVFVSPFIFSDP